MDSSKKDKHKKIALSTWKIDDLDLYNSMTPYNSHEEMTYTH